MPKPLLLSILEVGGYPDLAQWYARAGYRVEKVQGIRKALLALKHLQPQFVVAEFNYAPTYGSRISTVEPLLARLQSHHPGARILLLVEKANAHHLDTLTPQYGVLDFLTFPVQKDQLLTRLAAHADHICANGSLQN